MNHELKSDSGETKRKASEKSPTAYIFFLGCFITYFLFSLVFIRWMTSGDDLPSEGKSYCRKCVDMGIAHWDLTKSRTTEFQFNEPSKDEETTEPTSGNH